MRLGCMEAWIRSWVLPEMHAGVPERGAVDVWHEVLHKIEDLKLEERSFCGRVADIAKFCDQIRRELVYQLAEAAGMPKPIVRAYKTYLENLRVYNCLAGGIGTPYQRKCGIPQGCPYSMAMVALIMRPWIIMMRSYGSIQCYILADDVLIMATGKNDRQCCEGP